MRAEGAAGRKAWEHERCEQLGDEVCRAVFVLYRQLILSEFTGFSTGRPAWQMAEQAVCNGDFGRCRLFASLH